MLKVKIEVILYIFVFKNVLFCFEIRIIDFEGRKEKGIEFVLN